MTGKCRAWSFLEIEAIKQADRLHDGHEFVVAVRAFAGDFKEPVDLGGSVES